MLAIISSQDKSLRLRSSRNCGAFYLSLGAKTLNRVALAQLLAGLKHQRLVAGSASQTSG